jgi:glucosylglycerate synthase
LAEDSFLTDEFLKQLSAAGEVDILIGLPTFNNRSTIEHVVQSVQIGLAKYFPRERTVIVSADGGSHDGTQEAVEAASIQDFRSVLAANPLRTTHRVLTSYPGMLGKGGAVRLILAAADLLRAKACALISPDLESITPEWVEGLVRPVFREKYDFVSPLYQRHRNDGLLVTNLVAPLVSAVYGTKIAEPVGGELGFSGALACHTLAEDIWRGDLSRLSPETWMTTAAVAGGFRVCQSFLGPKVHAGRASGKDLVATIQQVVGTLFHSLETREAFWTARQDAQEVPVFGFEYTSPLGPMRVNRKHMVQKFRTGIDQLASVLGEILPPEILQGLQEVARQGDHDLRFSDELWVKAIYGFACSYHHSVINRDHLLQALAPLYHGRAASFVLEESGNGEGKVKAKFEALRAEFQHLKPQLVEGWTAKVR